MISFVIASCLNKPSRKEYLQRQLEIVYDIFSDIEFEVLIGFDKYGCDIDGAKCYVHNNGLGHSWNWGIKNSKFNYILQTEDDWVIKLDQKKLGSKEVFFDYFFNRIKVVDSFGGIFRYTCSDDEFWAPGKTECVLNGFNFLEANRPVFYKPNTWDMFLYTNHPHIKKKSLHDKIGYYEENVPVYEVESSMCQTFFYSGERVFMNDFFTHVHIGEEQSRTN